MSAPREVRIDRLVLPASEARNAAAFRAALERGLAARLDGGRVATTHESTAERTAAAVAARITAATP